MTDLFDRFMAKFTIGDDCWEWTASKRPDGYGQIRAGGKFMSLAHRISYELLVGPIPEGLVLDHLCRNRGCVRPAHLEPVTIAENVNRGIRTNQNRNKEYCKRGHALFGENLYTNPNRGNRTCKTCQRVSVKKYRANLSKVEE